MGPNTMLVLKEVTRVVALTAFLESFVSRSCVCDYSTQLKHLLFPLESALVSSNLYASTSAYGDEPFIDGNVVRCQQGLQY